MKRTTGIFILLLLVASAITPAALAQDYLLGPGDILTVNVWGHDDLSLGNAIIRPDGKIAFPMAGEMVAEGLSSGALTTRLVHKLKDRIKDPNVTINVQKFRTTRVYVLGEVNKPGMYELEKRHNLLDALGAAGGPNKNAAKKKVLIIAKDQKSEPIKANLVNLLEKADMSQNYALGEGDLVYLTSNGKIDVAKDILPFLSGTYYLKNIID